MAANAFRIDPMHGIIFLYLQKFAHDRAPHLAWERLLGEASLPQKSYSAVREYPDEEALALIVAASRLLHQPLPAVLEAFGEFIAPELLSLYNTLIDPAWKTLDVIAHTEKLIHAAVRVRNPGAKPPVLECFRTSQTDLQIMYSSPRKLCRLAKGIVKGLARHFGEEVSVVDEACMLRGDPFCALHITQTIHTPLEDEPSTHLIGGATLFEMLRPLQTIPGYDRREDAILTSQARPFAFLDAPRRPDELGRLSHYRVLQLLGEGSMGKVFRAADMHLERIVALKVMHPHLAFEREMQQRFLREARTLAALKSDHVVTVYEVGVANDAPFLAMEFLEGETLLVHRGRVAPLPLARVLRFGKEIAEGIAAVHAKGLIHRDIKPGNLWVESPSGRVKILDFGLARGSAETAELSQPGLIVGTPGFMSPEQVSGQPVDYRADLFSLGCVLYWLCTGERPFRGSDVLSTLSALATQQPQDLRASEFPAEFCNLVMQMLNKTPLLRPLSSRAVVEQLAALEAGHNARFLPDNSEP